MLKLNEKEKEQIINFGAFNYSIQICSKVLDIPEDVFSNEFKNPNSEIYKLFEIGKARAEYVIDLKLFEQSQTGDLKALAKFEARKRERAEIQKKLSKNKNKK